MLKKNSLPIGLAIGIALPTVGFMLLYLGYNQLAEAGLVSDQGFSANFRERTTAVIAICLNIIPLNVFKNRRATQSMRGVVIATVGLVVLWMLYFGQHLL